MKTASTHNATNMKGFSLMELAVVLTIVGILLSGVLMAVSQSAENTRRIETRAQLNGLMQALHGFAQANGRLP
ncbi:MAG: prepilin-type N-terminal cleavage/methylation domain-containing protein, partial [Natronospirillum sp.]